MRQILAIAFLCLALPCLASDIYFGQASAGSNNGTSCANQYAYNDGTHGINVAGNWVAGNTLHLCGTITVATNTNFITAKANGSSGNPITVKFEAGALISSPEYGTGANSGIFLDSHSFITVDGGNAGNATGTWNTDGTITSTARTGGMIFNSATGSSGHSNCPGAALTFTQSCTQQTTNTTIISALGVDHIIIENLGPCYGAIITAGSFGNGAPGNDCIQFQGTNVTITNNQFYQDGNGIDNTGFHGDSNTVITNNEFNDNGWGIGCAGNVASPMNTNYQISGNHFFGWAQWAATGTHLNGIHCYDGSGGGIQDLFLFNNVFDPPMSATGWTTFVYLQTDGSDGSWSGQVGAVHAFNNIFKDTTGLGNGLLQTGGGVSHENFNNTYWGCLVGSCQPGGGTGIATDWGGSGITITNNAFIQVAEFSQSDANAACCGGPANGVTQMDYNAYGQANSGNPFLQFGALHSNTLICWRTATGFDAHSVSTNNAFSAPLANITDHGVPSAGAITIGAGTNLTSKCNGYSGTNAAAQAACLNDTTAANTRTPTARPSSGAWDIGAYQFGASNPPPAPFPAILAHGQFSSTGQVTAQ